jgi:hypothetical protein
VQMTDQPRLFATRVIVSQEARREQR